MPCSIICTISTIYAGWYMYRLFFLHPDVTLYNLGLWFTKPWVQQMRFNKKIELDQPVYRWVHRSPEYLMTDPMREMYKLGIIANDPYLEYLKSIGREKELELYPHQRKNGKGDLLPLNIEHKQYVPHNPPMFIAASGK